MKELFKIETPDILLIGKIESDAMKLFLDASLVHPKEGEGRKVPPHLTRKEVIDLLAPKVTIDDTHLPVIDDVIAHLSRGEAVTERRIARGTPPEPGSDGKLLLLVKKFTGVGEVKGEGGVLSEMHLFDNVQTGQIVARVYPPKPGTPGKDVTGKVLHAPAGKPAKVVFDKSLQLTRSPNSADPFEVLVAQQGGLLKDDNGRLLVTDQLVLGEGLDLRFGNIDFVGSVVVRGDVAPGLSIRAGKGIEVTGNIRGGKFICPGGDITVRGFLYGGPNNQVLSGRNIHLRVAQAAEVEALGDITVDKEAAQCVLRVGASLLMPTGKLVGGECFVVCGAEVKVTGNEAGLATTLRMGSDVESTTEYGKLKADVANHDKAIQLMKLHLGPLARDASRIKLLQPAHRIQMEKMLTKLRQVEQSKFQLAAKLKKMLQEARHNPVQRINVHTVAHAGTKVCRGDKCLELKDDVKGPTTIEFNVEKGDFEVGPMKPLECQFTKADDPKKGGPHGK